MNQASKQQLSVESTLKSAIARPTANQALTTPTSGRRAGLARDPKTFVIDVDRIRPDNDQVRRIDKGADSRDIRELAKSIEQHGLLNAVDVRWLADHDIYELVAGEGRFTAITKILKWDTIPIRVIEASDEEVVWLQLHENIHRRQLHPLDLAAALQRAVSEQGLNLQQVAQKLNKSKSLVQKSLTVAEHLIPEAVEVLQSAPNAASLAIIYEVATLPAERQLELANKIAADKLTYRQVVALSAEVKRQRTPEQKARGGRPAKKAKPYCHTFNPTNGLIVTVKARRAIVTNHQEAAALSCALATLQKDDKRKAA